MTIYTVLVPGTDEAKSDPMAPVFVKEGFAWPALFFAPLWLIFRRLWLALLGYVIAVAVIGAIGNAIGDTFTFAGMVLLHFLLALEGNELRRRSLGRRGYRLTAIVDGRGVEDAEIRYFAGLSPRQEDAPGQPTPPAAGPIPPRTPPAPPPLGPINPSAEAGEVIGLFPAPGART
jgi:hypothetical protein